MKSPLRILNAWIDHQRLTERRREVEWQLGVAFRQPVTLRPVYGGGGFDRVYQAHGNSPDSKILACVRMNVPGVDRVPKEPNLPRVALSGHDRIHRESHAYRQLSPMGIAPRLVARGEYFLANEWLPWPRFADVLRYHGNLLWDLLPVALNAVREMHEQGVVHMDLNCGNLLVAPNFQAVVIIDFEFAPLHSMIQFDQQRFDYLRLAHNLLKPRRGREAAFKQPRRFVDMFAHYVPETGFGIPDAMNSKWFSRVTENDTILRGFEDIFGVLDVESKAFA